MTAASVLRGMLGTALLLLSLDAPGHGGVVEEDDLCVINIGYLKAHFKIYVPAESGHRDYCEDIPVRGESVFVMEYQHDGLAEAAIDFRIIENLTGKGTFARLEDVEAIDDIDSVTVHHEPYRVVPGVYTLLQPFDEDGEYIGIVSAKRQDTDRVYTAVFPFEVGYTGLGYWPWVVAALLALQLNYWWMSRRRTQRAAPTVAALATALLLPGVLIADGNEAAQRYSSVNGHFRLSYEAELEPLTINRIHTWNVQLTRSDGSAVVGATLIVAGGMPEHDHGLPTAPSATESDAEGRYRIGGMRFHMRGDWEVEITIDDGSLRDTVIIPLTL